MKEIHLFYAPDIATEAQLPDDEAAHAVRVLRMKEGDTLLATDGKGTFYDCRLTLATPKRCLLRIERTERPAPLWQGRIELAVAPTKNIDRIEWLAEKATEIGWDRLCFLDCANSERRVVKTERIRRVVVAAMKQSRKPAVPEVDEMTDFDALLAQPFDGQRYIAHCHDAATLRAAGLALPEHATEEDVKPFLADVLRSERDAQVLIGPEGDFSAEEVRRAAEAGCQPVSLGRSRLRTETAALVAVHLMNLSKRL